MKIELICIEKTKKVEYKSLIEDYLRRINKKISFSINEIPFVNIKNQTKEKILIKQANLIEKQINDKDYVVLLDEGGKSFSSINFSRWLNAKITSRNIKCLKFIICGPYGFKKKLNLIHEEISFSKMTFSHQMIRVFVLEQIYRSLKIVYNEPYHNE